MRNLILLIGICSFLIICGILIIMNMISKENRMKQIENKLRENTKIELNNYDGFVSNSQFLNSLSNNYLVRFIGQGSDKNENELRKLFDDSKNPWGITPTIFRFLRMFFLILGIALSLTFYFLFGTFNYVLIGIFISAAGWIYPMYFYKATAKERKDEWNKIYEFIWVIKNTCMLYDAKKVCLETKKYIMEHYPNYKELIEGFNDFYNYWDDEKKSEYILRYYDFAVPKEIYEILFNMNDTGIYPGDNLTNLRNFALNKHNELILNELSKVPSKATINTLPFLMISVLLSLITPMIIQIIGAFN